MNTPATASLGARNLLRNRRRSSYTILAIAIGFAAVCVFGGFNAYINAALRDSYVYAQAQGHLTIVRTGYLEHGFGEPRAFLFDPVSLSRILESVSSRDEVLLATPRLAVTGLLSSGDRSLVFIGEGVVPSDVETMTEMAPGFLGRIEYYQGNRLRDDLSYGVGVGTGLAHKLDLEVGSPVIAVATTAHGQMNALDAETVQTFEPSAEVLRDKLLLMPLDFAQSLYDSVSADRIIVLLEANADVSQERDEILADLRGQGLDVELATWEELSPFYRRVRQMFATIFGFVFVIVFVIVLMSVINTVSMAVMERTREIGTLRALGVKRAGVIRLFCVESGILGLIGSLTGIALTLLVWAALEVIEPQWVPPISAHHVPIEIELVPVHILASVLALVVLSVLAGTFPARRAARRNIVETLSHA